MTGKKWDVFIYGDINIDIVIPGVEQLPGAGQEHVIEDMSVYPGGGAALFSLGLGKLGLTPAFQGSVGADCHGTWLREELMRSHVDCTFLRTSLKSKTGISLSFTNEKDRSFLTYRGTNEEWNLEEIDFDGVKNSGHIHLTSYAGSRNHHSFKKVLKKIREISSATVSFDVGWDETGEWYEGIYELLPFIDILFMNEAEAVHYTRGLSAKEAALEFSKHCAMAVIKLGKKGSIGAKDGTLTQSGPYTVNAVDTTGAGDSFNAGFVYGFLKGDTMKQCLILANACGAMSVTAYGGNTAFPSNEELYHFLKLQNERQEG
ncbi:carbohydrate kinase family protein [Clostridium boliviensis]|uniref:Carbohydrate kinase family protein n=1 Tax=Clostridium boliviensis TaxID=318465 RepID=A0ABU4GNC2_9CLOT|nr:carbohydrate kinase family protein [Clostridium boliviensis]MDW2799121.1 carbohydrate kinase family protein [Clostridium boliviensis]